MQPPRSLRRRLSGSRRPITNLLVGCGSLLLVSLPVWAQQGGVPFNAVRALNLARNTGVTLNGGLTVYRPAACMFTTSAPENPCLVQSNDQGFLFRFLGGPPGWQVLNIPPTLETELLIAPDGRSVVQVIYNGVPR